MSADSYEVDQADVDAVVAALGRDEVVAIPTDTVYGLAANPRSPTAMTRLFALKQRPEGVPIAVLAASVDQARSLVTPSDVFDELAKLYWPGALTMVAATAPTAQLHIGAVHGTQIATVGVRVPDHELVQRCAAQFGPIAATSANVHGAPTIIDPKELAAIFGEQVGVLIDGGVLIGQASTVIDITKPLLEVLRQGVVLVDYTN